MEGGSASLTLALALAAGVAGQSVARHLRLPGIVILLAVGVLLGPDLLAWVDPRSLGEGLFVLVELAVAVILFEGGLNLELSRLLRSQVAIRRLVTWGALLTLVGAALAVRWILDWSWLLALLFGSLVVVTGPTVVGPLVGELRLQPRTATVLEAEGVLIDPIGAILAVLVLEVVLVPDTETLTSGALSLLMQLGLGGAAGALGGFALAGLLRVRRLVPDGFENIFALGSVLLLFAGSDALVAHSGILAVPIAGVVVGNLRTRVDRDLREFKDQLSMLLIGLIFVLLAADVRVEDVRELGLGGVAVVAALVAIVRPTNVLLCTLGSSLSLSERAFVSWVAPRGIVAAAIATLTASALEGHELAGGPELRALVFMTIAGTVFLAGVTALPVAALLGVRLPGRNRFGILGVTGLGLSLAQELQSGGEAVVFLDANPASCRRAEDAGFPVVFGDALQERTLARARFESVGTAVGMTPNDALNLQFARAARELFGVPRALVALRRSDPDPTDAIVPLFQNAHDLERWEVRMRHDEAELQHWRYRGEQDEAQISEGVRAFGERCVLLAARRGRRVLPVSREYAAREGDELAIAIHSPDREDVATLLREHGFEPIAETPSEN